jgi:dTDP-4-dehydrorhamnose 3,5-epimerase
VLLSAKKQNQIFVPAGFAYGFLALTDSVQFLYKCGDYYDPTDEHGIAWNDPDLNIDWGVENPLVSEKDARHPTLAGSSTAIPDDMSSFHFGVNSKRRNF